MAVSLVTTVQRWIGLAADTKPASAPVGSYFYAADTNVMYRWNGSSWVQVAANYWG